MTTITIPSTPDELEELLHDSSKIRAVIENGQFPDVVKQYATNIMQADKTLQEQIKSEVQITLKNWLTENKKDGVAPVDFDPKTLTPGSHLPLNAQRRKIYNAKAPGAALNKEFDDAGQFFRSIWYNSKALRDSDEIQARLERVRKIQNSFSSVVPDAGGYLIPETLRSEILSVALETALVRPLARVIPMETLAVPIPSIDATSNASSVFGGIVAYWTEEAASLTESQASFGRVRLESKKLTAYAEVPNELMADAPAFGAFFSQLFPEAVAYYEDYAFLQGSGTGEPLGVLNSGNAGVVQVLENTANNIKWDDVVAMYKRMLPSSLGRAVWVASIDTFDQLAKMTVSGATIPLWLTGGQGIDSPPLSLLGRPIYFTEKVPALGTTGFGALSFIDFGYYLIGDRQAMTAESSPHYKFANDKTAFRIIERVDGRPWLQTAITPKNGSATLSPYVSLQSA